MVCGVERIARPMVSPMSAVVVLVLAIVPAVVAVAALVAWLVTRKRAAAHRLNTEQIDDRGHYTLDSVFTFRPGWWWAI